MYSELKNFGKVRTNVPLSKLTTFHIGGPADFVIEVKETEKLIDLLNFLSAEGADYFVLGDGSNVLFPDEGYRGVVVRIRSQRLEVRGQIIEAEAGVLLGTVVELSVKNDLGGLEWAAGIPGTVGGAVRGNAGARFAQAGGEMGDSVEKVEAWQDGEVLEYPHHGCQFGYRDSLFKHNHSVILRVWLRCCPGDRQKSLAIMQEIIQRRIARSSTFPSAGSFFKNIKLENWSGSIKNLPEEFIRTKKIPAGWLIEQVGLKGFRLGGAMISEEHANFLINFNKATQADVLMVVEEVKRRVYTTFGIELEAEVQIVQ